MDEYEAVDDDVVTCREDTLADILKEVEEGTGDESEEEMDSDDHQSAPLTSEASQAVELLQRYFQKEGCLEHGQQRYTVVGFSNELDWRELNFAEPIPSHRICQACGMITRMTAFLPCLHVFCKKCYEQCRHDDAYGCPLDCEKFCEGDVQWLEFPVQNLLSRKVKCWNGDRGCDKILVASELNRHFCLDCDHH
ncbi:hypothetical protein HPB50_010433 [Hyalomma asiaticum]|uniref:Uncharacterized protein n=1 Tax=Hyalomma asiaticum TaxID=266040 RepID=A0ACB7RMX8_HYAAI|nr:hypothetical protein HPB50_010433 [Hyalomma asiaticum]